LLEAINAPITKMTPASPPEPCCLDLHRGGCSLFCQSANEPWQHGIRHTTLPNYNIMLIWPHLPSVLRHSSQHKTRHLVPSSTTAQSQDQSSPTCTSPSQLVAFFVAYFIPSFYNDAAVFANRAHMLLFAKVHQHIMMNDVITTINCYGKQLHNHLYPCLILIFILL
jgi:hypothetical protein